MNAKTKASIHARRMSFVGCAVRAVSPATLIGLVAATCLVLGVVEQAQVLHRAHAINQQRNDVRALLAAETAVLSGRGMVAPSSHSDVTTVVEWQDELVRVDVRAPNGTSTLVSQRLAGGASPAFTHTRTATDKGVLQQIGGGVRQSSRAWPTLDRTALAKAEVASEAHGFRRDAEIALRHLPNGSDRPDFVWRANVLRRTRHPKGGLLIVQGNLWLDGESTRVLDISQDLTVLVTGNIYVLRSLHVRGHGRLLLATDTSEQKVVFADVDGSGGWSRGDSLHHGTAFGGPIEGAGNVYLGLPGGTPALECDAGILAGGELHIATRAEVRGPLLLRFGCTMLGDNAHLGAPLAQSASSPQTPGRRRGQWVFAAGRDAVPGFEVSGPPRPGRLEFRSR